MTSRARELFFCFELIIPKVAPVYWAQPNSRRSRAVFAAGEKAGKKIKERLEICAMASYCASVVSFTIWERSDVDF